MEPREPTVEFHGPAATHDQRCAVMPGESAVLDMNTGVFLPCWKAQAKGWHLVRARTWWQRLALSVLAPNAPHEGADASLSRTLPLDAVVGGHSKRQR